MCWGSLWRLPNHPPKRTVHQTVSIYLFFVQSNFFECTSFFQVPPLSSISPLEVPASVCLPGSLAQTPTCRVDMFLRYTSWASMELLFDFRIPLAISFRCVCTEKWECPNWRPSSWFLTTSLSLPLPHSFSPLPPPPQIRFFTPSKNKNDGPKKHRKCRGPKTYRISNSQNDAKNRVCTEWTAKKNRPQNVSDPKRSFWAFFEGREKQKKSTPKICGAAVNLKGKPRTTTESQWSTTEWKSTQPPTAIPTDSKVCKNWGSRCPSRP